MTEISSLRRRMIEDMTVRNLSQGTQRSYLHAVSKFSRFFGRSPGTLTLEDVRTFQVHLASKRMVWASVNHTVAALRFFHGVTLGMAEIPERIAYARKPRRLPVVLSADEVVRFTGTPISRVGADTQAVFGDCIDICDVARALEDGATVPIYYEGRVARIELAEIGGAVLDAEYDEILEEAEANGADLDDAARAAMSRNPVSAPVALPRRVVPKACLRRDGADQRSAWPKAGRGLAGTDAAEKAREGRRVHHHRDHSHSLEVNVNTPWAGRNLEDSS